MRLDTTVVTHGEIPPVHRVNGLVFQPHYMQPKYGGTVGSKFRYSLVPSKSTCGQCNTKLETVSRISVTSLGFKRFVHKCPNCNYGLFNRFDYSHLTVLNIKRNFFVRLYYQFKNGLRKLRGKL